MWTAHLEFIKMHEGCWLTYVSAITFCLKYENISVNHGICYETVFNTTIEITYIICARRLLNYNAKLCRFCLNKYRLLMKDTTNIATFGKLSLSTRTLCSRFVVTDSMIFICTWAIWMGHSSYMYIYSGSNMICLHNHIMKHFSFCPLFSDLEL